MANVAQVFCLGYVAMLQKTYASRLTTIQSAKDEDSSLKNFIKM
jgi:hypothetical protein